MGELSLIDTYLTSVSVSRSQDFFVVVVLKNHHKKRECPVYSTGYYSVVVGSPGLLFKHRQQLAPFFGLCESRARSCVVAAAAEE